MKFHIHREDPEPLAGFTATPRAHAAHAKFRTQKCCRQQQKLTGAVKFLWYKCLQVLARKQNWIRANFHALRETQCPIYPPGRLLNTKENNSFSLSQSNLKFGVSKTCSCQRQTLNPPANLSIQYNSFQAAMLCLRASRPILQGFLPFSSSKTALYSWALTRMAPSQDSWRGRDKS